MKCYWMFNFEETKQLFIGEFEDDNSFWEYYFSNEFQINQKQYELDHSNAIWHMTKF